MVLSTLIASLALGAPATVLEAVRTSVPEGRRAEVVRFQAEQSDCQVQQAALKTAVRTSGRVAVQLKGQMPNGAACEAWGWVQVAVYGKAWVTTKPLRAGDALMPATVEAERELKSERTFLNELPADAQAARALPLGTALEEHHVKRSGVAWGAKVTVSLQVGALVVEQTGRSLPCGREKTCALLANGKRVEGQLSNGKLWIVMP
ncbi:MAG: hypothetical protein K1X64_06630 [Myxococcaceae bacterium]|nr:hypothetical protein [Myxococcaceae bacterium]